MWTFAGACTGLTCLVIVYAAHPMGFVGVHREFAAAYLLDVLPILLGWMGWLTARLKAARAQLRNTLNTLSPWSDGAGLDALLDAALLVGPDRVVVAANPAALAHFGSRSLVGTSIQRLLPNLDNAQNRRREHRARGRNGPLIGFEWDMRARRADDTTVPVTVHCGPATSNRIVYIIRPTSDHEVTAMPSVADRPSSEPAATIVPNATISATLAVPRNVVLVSSLEGSARRFLEQELAGVGLPDVIWLASPDLQEIRDQSPRAVVVDARTQQDLSWLSNLLHDPSLAGVPLLVATEGPVAGVPQASRVGSPIDAHEISSRLRILDRTVGGCVVVGASPKAQRVHHVLSQAGWAAEVQPSLAAADTSLRARRRSLVVVVDQDPQDPGAFASLTSVRGLVLCDAKPAWDMHMWPERTFPSGDAQLVEVAADALLQDRSG